MRVPSGIKTERIEIRKSVFISTAVPVESEEQIKLTLERTRAEHPKCDHVVYAYSVGLGGNRTFGMSDDGEPKGTAGKPALNVLRYSGFTNILVTVVRYFGGTNLGRGGLVKAYTESVKLVLEKLPSRTAVLKETVRLVLRYEQYEIVRKIMKEFGAREESRLFEERVTLEVSVDRNLTESMIKDLMAATNGRITLKSVRKPGTKRV